jgi:hypothetical protein
MRYLGMQLLTESKSTTRCVFVENNDGLAEIQVRDAQHQRAADEALLLWLLFSADDAHFLTY